MGMPFLRGHVVKCQMSNWSNWNFGILVFIFHTNYHELTMNGWRGLNSKLSTLLCHVSHVLHGFGKLKLVFFKHELSLINHELTINGWRGLLFLRVIALRIENPYNSLRQIANLPQRSAVLRLKAN